MAASLMHIVEEATAMTEKASTLARRSYRKRPIMIAERRRGR
jgi:hypothetical protein